MAMNAFRRALFAVLFLSLPALAPAVHAQEAAEQSAESSLTPEQAQSISELLRDEAAREALIGQIQLLAGQAAPEDAPAREAAPTLDPEPEVSLPRRIAKTTQELVDDATDEAERFWHRLLAVPANFAGLSGVDLEFLLDSLLDLTLVIVTTVALFLVFRRVAERMYRAIGGKAAGAGVLATWMLILVAMLLDALVVVAAWGAGYLVATVIFGEFGAVGIRQSLYLNAFLLVELGKVVLRAILSPATGNLRPIPISDSAARQMTNWLGFVVSLVGYGQLLVVPIVNQNVSFFAGSSVGALIALTAIVIVAVLVVVKRRPVAAWLLGERRLEERSGLLRFLARNWHLPVLLYLAVLLILAVTRPGGVLMPVLVDSAEILAAVLAGMAVANALKRSTARGVHLPNQVSQQLPLLERRINAFVPKALIVLRLVIGLAVVAFVVHTVDLVDVRAWLESRVGVELTGILLSILLVLAVSWAVWLAFSSWIDYRLNPEIGSVPTVREQTLLTLLRNAATIALVIITFMFILSEIGIDIAPLLASAGVLGLAIGFGAQKLVQDIITGIFIQFENAMNVGEVVTVGGTTGTVERLTIRSVSLRDLSGVFHIIPFSSVDMVSNYMREYGHFVCDMGIAYREKVEDAKQAMLDAFAELREKPEWKGAILEDMQWFGLNAFGDSALVVRSRIKCAPGMQWAVGRAYNEIVKRIFDERGIEIPFPHQPIYFGEDKEGKAPPAHLKMSREKDGEVQPSEAGAGS